MIHGRVIGNELRDVPPEYLPIWGQRWSGYRAPHGPSPFSTRIFDVDRMSEIGPVLTSPAQFEAALTEVDEGEDTNSEPSRLCSSFPSPPLAIQLEVGASMSRPEAPAHRSVRSSSRLHGSPRVLRWSEHPPPQNPVYFDAPLPSRWQPGQLDIQQYGSGSLLHPPTPHHGTSNQGSCGSFENDFALCDMDPTSVGIQPRAGGSERCCVRSGQLQPTTPHSSSGWQFTNSYNHSSAYPLQPILLSRPGYLSQSLQDNDQARVFPTLPPPPPSSRYFAVPFSQQNIGIDSSRSHEPNAVMIPMPPSTTISQWSSESAPSSSPLVGSLRNSFDPEGCYCSASSYNGTSPRHEGLLGAFACTGGCVPLSYDKPEDDRFTK